MQTPSKQQRNPIETALCNIVLYTITAALEEINTPEGFKSFVHDTFATMMRELTDLQHQVMTNYKNNPTIPFDYYSLMLREIDTKIQCKKEVYKRLTGDELDFSDQSNTT